MPVLRDERTVVAGKARKGFFFEKKKQKTSLSWGTGCETGTGPEEQSFFCFFFVHKKEGPLLSCPAPLRSAGLEGTVIDPATI
jgi:hypothetical protein